LKPIEILSESEIKAIHHATIQILEETGVRLTHPKACAMLIDAGCLQNEERITIPEHLVQSSLATSPSSFTLRGRGGKSITFGDGTLHWHNTGGVPAILDRPGGESRQAMVKDQENATRLLDAIEGIDEIVPLFTPHDVPFEVMNLAMYRYALPHTIKPLGGPGLQYPQEVRSIYEMASVIGPPAEILSIPISPISPLFFPDDVTDSIMETARLGISLVILPSPTAGVTAPMTLAGAIALQSAEVLAGIVLAQLINPGLSIMYCGRLSLIEPRSGRSAWGVPMLGLSSAACVQMGHYYNLPVNVYGLATDSNQLDIQNGYERAINAILPALTGADAMSGIGDLGAGTVSSFAQIMADNDIAMSIKHLLSGMQVDERTLAVELTDEMNKTNGTYMAEKHTVQALRSGETYYPALADRRLFDEWLQAGGSGMVENADEKAVQLINEHEVPPLELSQEQELDKIMKAAEKEITL
jgi:trimethylamine--corrinoid protein Co-methyltransferase